MSRLERLLPRSTLVAVIDVQERLAAAMPAPDFADLVRGTSLLLEAARLLGAPVVATEQYPKGLGSTVAALAGPLDAIAAPRIEKLEFSACDAAGFVDRIAAAAPKAVVVVGMEAHVCVYQTVRDLTARHLPVYVPIDAVVSRRPDHKQTGLHLCERTGAVLTTSESIVFDWLRRAGGDVFRALSQRMR